ncbi:MAG: NYN domain-containing protein [Acidobacteriia bacterium]|nr:NYN domain-containing protein [Terriglobia bacterium]
MAELVYVDNSNLFIEGRRVKAVDTGAANNIYDAMNNRILDMRYKIDFGKLHSLLAGDDMSAIKRCMLFGSRPPPNDSLWEIATRVGFEVRVVDRNAQNREKKVDTGIVTAMLADSYEVAETDSDVITLAAGDADYVPPVKALVQRGFTVHVAFWNHAARELKNAASHFFGLDQYLNHLQLR